VRGIASGAVKAEHVWNFHRRLTILWPGAMSCRHSVGGRDGRFNRSSRAFRLRQIDFADAIAGLDEVDSGRIVIGETDVTTHEPNKRGIAMVFQSYALYPKMTVRRNLSFGLRVNKAAKPKSSVACLAAGAAAMILYSTVVEPTLRRPSASAWPSGGLWCASSVYLFDERSQSRRQVPHRNARRDQTAHKDLGCTIVYVTHDQVER